MAVVAAACPIATTVATGTLIVAMSAPWQADARDMTTSTTTVSINGEDTVYNGYVWTLTDFSTTATNDLIAGGENGVKFTHTVYDSGTGTWVQTDPVETYYSNQEGDLGIDGVSGGSRFFWTIWCNKDTDDYFLKYGYTLRLAGATGTMTGDTHNLVTSGLKPLTLGGLITEAGEGGSYVLTGGSTAQGVVFTGTNAVNMDIQADTTLSYRGTVSLQQDGTWVIGSGKTLLFNNCEGYSSGYGSLTITAGKELTIDGGGTMQIGEGSNNGFYRLIMEQGTAEDKTKLNITGGSTVYIAAGAGTNNSFAADTELNIDTAGTFRTHGVTYNSGAVDVKGTFDAQYSNLVFTNQQAGRFTVQTGGRGLFANLTNEGAFSNAGTVSVSRDLSNGSTANPTGTVVNQKGATITITGTLRNFVSSQQDDHTRHDITNYGTISAAAVANWGNIYNGTELEEDSAAVMTITGDLNSGNGHTHAVVYNFGTMSAGSITNYASVNNNGTMTVGGNVASTGMFANTGDLTVNGTMSINPGEDSYLYNLYGTTTINILNNFATVFNEASLNVTGNLASTGMVGNAGGELNVATANINAGANSHLHNMSGDTTIATLNNRAVISNSSDEVEGNEATMTVTGTATLYNGSVLTNHNGGTLSINNLLFDLGDRAANGAAYLVSTGTGTVSATTAGVAGYTDAFGQTVQAAGDNVYLMAQMGTLAKAQALIGGYSAPKQLTAFRSPHLAAAENGNVYLNVNNLIDPGTTVTLAAPGLTFSANTQAYRGVLADVTANEVTTGTATLTFSEDTQLDVGYTGGHVSAFAAERAADTDTPVTVTIGSLNRGGNGGTFTITGGEGVTVVHKTGGDLSVKTAQGNLTLAGNVAISAGGYVGVANGKTLTLEGNASVSALRLVLADDNNSAGTFILKDNASFTLTCTEACNEHNNQASLLLGHWSGNGSIGTLQVQGGTLNASNAVMYMQLDGTGVFTMTDGTVYVKGIDFGNKTLTDVKGSMTLDGGSLHIGEAGIIGVTRGAANAANSINWGDGTIVADDDWQTTVVTGIGGTPGAIHLTATADGESAKLDTNGHVVTFNHKLDGGGKLTKQGAGTVVFNRDVDGTLILQGGNAELSNNTTVTKLVGTGTADKGFNSTSATITTLEVETGATLNGTGGVKVSHIVNNGSLSLEGPVTWLGDSTISGAGDTTIDICTHNSTPTTTTKTGTGDLNLGNGIGLGNTLIMQEGTLSGNFSSGTFQVDGCTSGLVAAGKVLEMTGGALDFSYNSATDTLSSIAVGDGQLLFTAGNLNLGMDLASVAVDSTYTLFTYEDYEHIGYEAGQPFWGDVRVNKISVDDAGKFYITDADNNIIRQATLSVGATGVTLSLAECEVETLHWMSGHGKWNTTDKNWKEENSVFGNGEAVVFGNEGTSDLVPARIDLVGELDPALTTVTGYYVFQGEGKLTGFGRLVIGDGETATDLLITNNNAGWQGQMEVKNNAVLTIKNSEALGNAQIQLEEGSVFELTEDEPCVDYINLNQKVRGDGAVRITGYAHVDMTGSNTYRGGTFVSDNATLDVETAGALGLGDVTLNGNAVLNTKTQGAIGAGTIILNDDSKLVLGAEASITTNVLFNGGMLVYGDGVTGGVSRYMVQGTDSIKVDVNGNAVTWVRTPGTTLEVFDNSANGDGVFTLSGAGKTTASDGAENLVIHSGTVVFANGRALRLRGTGSTDACVQSNVIMTGGTLLLDSPTTTGGDGIWTATDNSVPAYLFLTTLQMSPDEGQDILIDSIERDGRKYGIGLAAGTALIYDGSKGGGTVTIAADISSTGSTSATMYSRTFDIGDSAGTDVEVDVTGSIGEAGASQESRSLQIRKTGAGTMRLSGANHMPEIRVTDGTLIINHGNAMGESKGNHDNIVYVGENSTPEAAILDLQVSNENGVMIGGTAKGVITNTTTTTTTLTVGQATRAGNSTFVGKITGNLNLNVAKHTLTLTGANDYTGSTTVANGASLVLSGNGSLDNGVLGISASAAGNATFTGTGGTGLSLTKDGTTTTLAGTGTLANAAIDIAEDAGLSLGTGVALSNTVVTLNGSSMTGGGAQTSLTHTTIVAAAGGNTLGDLSLTDTVLGVGMLTGTSPFSVDGGLNIGGSMNVQLSEIDRQFMLAHEGYEYVLLDNCTFDQGLSLSLNGQTLAQGRHDYEIKLGDYTYLLKLTAADGKLSITELRTLTNKMQWTGGQSGIWTDHSANTWKDLTSNTPDCSYEDESDTVVIFDGEGTATTYAVQVQGPVTPAQLLVQGKAQLTLTADPTGTITDSTISDTANVLVTGEGTSLTLSMSNNYSGGTTVEAGAALSTTAANAMGVGDVLVTGEGSTLTIGAASAHRNTMVEDGGTLYINSAASLGTGSISLGKGRLVLGCDPSLGNGRTITFNGGTLVFDADVHGFASHLAAGTGNIKLDVTDHNISLEGTAAAAFGSTPTPGPVLEVFSSAAAGRQGTLTLKYGSSSSALEHLIIHSGTVDVKYGTVFKSGGNTALTLTGGTLHLETPGNNGTNGTSKGNLYNNHLGGRYAYHFLKTVMVSLDEDATATIEGQNIANAVGIGLCAVNALTYDSTAGGTFTLAADITAWGSSLAAERVFNIADSGDTDIEVDITGVIGHGTDGVDGQSTTMVKNGAGTLRISNSNHTPGLRIQEGTVIAANAQALGSDRELKNTVTVGTGEESATLDLQTSNSTGVSKLAGNVNGVITNSKTGAASTLKVGNNFEDSCFDGRITGNVNLEVSTDTLTLTNAANDYSGSTTVAGSAQLALSGDGAIDNAGLKVTSKSDGAAPATMSGVQLANGSIGSADGSRGSIENAAITFKATGDTPQVVSYASLYDGNGGGAPVEHLVENVNLTDSLMELREGSTLSLQNVTLAGSTLLENATYGTAELSDSTVLLTRNSITDLSGTPEEKTITTAQGGEKTIHAVTVYTDILSGYTGISNIALDMDWSFLDIIMEHYKADFDALVINFGNDLIAPPATGDTLNVLNGDVITAVVGPLSAPTFMPLSVTYGDAGSIVISVGHNVPEPATATLSMLALAALAARRRRKAR